VQGTGGVAVFALQMAHAQGAAVVVTSSSDKKLEQITSLGLCRVSIISCIPNGTRSQTSDRWRRRAPHGGDRWTRTLARSIAATRFGGTVALVGVLTAGHVDPLIFMHKGLTLRSIGTGSRDMHEAVFRSMSVQAWRPVIDSVYPSKTRERLSIALRAAGMWARSS